jgi:hypothetical protein
MANLLALTTFDMGFELRPLCSAGITRPPCSYGPVRHPPRPGPIVTDPPLIPTLGITAMGFPCCVDSPCAHMPSPLPRRNLWVLVSLTSPEIAAFPVIQAGRLPHYRNCAVTPKALGLGYKALFFAFRPCFLFAK